MSWVYLKTTNLLPEDTILPPFLLPWLESFHLVWKRRLERSWSQEKMHLIVPTEIIFWNTGCCHSTPMGPPQAMLHLLPFPKPIKTTLKLSLHLTHAKWKKWMKRYTFRLCPHDALLPSISDFEVHGCLKLEYHVMVTSLKVFRILGSLWTQRKFTVHSNTLNI